MKNSILKKAVRLVTNNFGLKILAVIASCGLWVVVDNINDPLDSETFYNVPVDIINADLVTNEGKVYDVLDGTDVVNVTVRGKKSLLSYVAKEDIRAVADMSELTFMNTIGIDRKSVV